jgi:hypothetical protein
MCLPSYHMDPATIESPRVLGLHDWRGLQHDWKRLRIREQLAEQA